MLGESKTRKLLGEILHHVVALELAVDQYVKTDALLPADGTRRLVAQKCLVAGIAHCAPGMRSPGLRQPSAGTSQLWWLERPARQNADAVPLSARQSRFCAGPCPR